MFANRCSPILYIACSDMRTVCSTAVKASALPCLICSTLRRLLQTKSYYLLLIEQVIELQQYVGAKPNQARAFHATPIVVTAIVHSYL